MFASECLTFGFQLGCVVLVPLLLLVTGPILCLVVFPALKARQLKTGLTARLQSLGDLWTRVEVLREELHRLKHASKGEAVAQSTTTGGEEDQVGVQTGQEDLEGITDREISYAVQDAPSTSYDHGSTVSAADPHTASTSSGCRMRSSSASNDQDAASTSYGMAPGFSL